MHAHTGWEVSALTVDVKEMIHVNQEAGFAAGDRFLHAVADALARAFPRAAVVPIHTDCFAVLFLPSCDAALTESDVGRVRSALADAVAAFRSREPALRRPVEFTVGGLSLRIVRSLALAGARGRCSWAGAGAHPRARPRAAMRSPGSRGTP